jgi:hypothetical protein
VGDLTPVIGGVVVAIVGVVGAWINGRRLRKLGIGADMATVLAAKEQLADVWEEKFHLVTDELERERAAHAATREELRLERDAGMRCRRELDACRSDERAVERRRRPRSGTS